MAHITLELGDEIVLNGEWHIVSQINGTDARIVDREYKSTLVNRTVSDHLLSGDARLPDHVRVSHLNNFLTGCSADRAKELTEPITPAVELQGVTNMPRKTQSESNSKPQSSSGSDGKPSFDGITDFIEAQIKSGKRGEAVLQATRAKYPKCGRAWVLNVAERKANKIQIKS